MVHGKAVTMIEMVALAFQKMKCWQDCCYYLEALLEVNE